MPNNQELNERSLKAVWHPCTQMKLHEQLALVPIKRAQGVWLYDFDGRRYLDGISSWWVNLFGHCNPRINAALHAQLETFEHVMLAGLTHQPAVCLAERLSRLAPGRLGHCFFAADGACAVEIALKMSFHHWRNHDVPGKTRFISLQNGYHGETLGALGVCDVALFKDSYTPLLRPSAVVPTPDGRYAEPGESERDFAVRCARQLERYLDQHAPSIAAFVLEPLVQGATGMGMYHPEYLARARAVCDHHRVHLIADEIAVGFGRSGTFFACEQAGVAADFLCLSKGITGGYLPLAAVLTSDEVFKSFYHDEVARSFLHSHSYSGNALACTAALAVLDIFAEDDVLETNRAKARFLNDAAQALRAHPRVEHFRNTGMIWAFDVRGADTDFARWFYREALKRELLLRPIGNTVYFMPPYVIDEQEIELLLSRVVDILDALPEQHNDIAHGAGLVG
ncbi:MAG: adenosylmethionine--8-amino-7-oxononanoate transaminase [Burkholderiales bacterium]